MKKLLALVLALVMSMSLVTISNAAFKDADKIDYKEAVTVMNAVGVLVGDENSNFNAKENLTRAQAAKIISYLLLGNKTAEALAGSGKFTDVAKNSWSAGFVDYCASTGVVNGVGDGKFDPNGQLTGYQFAKMLLVALGYDAKIEGFTGADWQINVSKRADQADLFDNLDISGNTALTREQAAQMCLNTLKSPLVEYSNKGGSLTVNGATVNIGASNAEYKTSSTKLAEQTIYANELNSSSGKYIVEFAEQYYPKLVLDTDFDDFGRPCYTWSYDKKDLGTFAMKDMLEKTYVGKVTGRDLYDLLGKSVVEDYEVFVAIDGVEDSNVNDNVFNKTAMNKNNKKAVGGTGTGVVTEVYVNNDAKQVYIVIVNEYLAIASADYDTKKETVKLDVYGIDKVTGKNEYVKFTTATTAAAGKESMTVSSDDFALVADAKEDDAYVVTVADGEVQAIAKAEIVADATVTSFTLGEKVVAGGTTYDYSSAAEYNFDVLDKYTGIDGRENLKGKEYNLYLDTHGNLLGIDVVASVDNYVFITGMDLNDSNIAARDVKANAIFLDGTSKTITINWDKSKDKFVAATLTRIVSDPSLANLWCTYTVSKDDVYTVSEVAGAITDKVKTAQYTYDSWTAPTVVTIDKKHVSLVGAASGNYSKVYGNDDSVYLVAKLKKIDAAKTGKSTSIISGVNDVITGVRNASLTAKTSDTVKTDMSAVNAAGGTYTLYKSNGYVIASVVVADDYAASENIVYAVSGNVKMESYDSAADEWTWTREVIIDGEKTELKVVGSELDYIDKNSMAQYNWYVVKYNAKGEVISDPVLAKETNGLNKPTKDQYTDTETEIEGLIENQDVVLFEKTTYADVVKLPYLIGNTFYVDTQAKTGFFVDDDVKFALIQTNDNKTTTEYGQGVDDLEDIVESLNADKKDGKYDYEIGAILKNGAATTVIIHDKNDATGNSGSTPAVANGTVTVSYDPTTKKTSVASPVINSADVSNWDFSSGKMYVSTTVDGKEFPKDFTLDATKKLSAAITALGDDVAAVSMQGTGYQIRTDVTLVFTGLDGNTYKLTGSTGVIFN